MKKVGSPGGFSPALDKMIKDASQSGKQIGAPKLNKAMHGLHLGQLKKLDQKKLHDFFEHAPLTPKARALMEKLLQGGSQGPSVRPEVVKVRADQPTGTQTSGPTTTTPPVVKVRADQPTGTQTSGPTTTTPPVVKVRADQP